MEQVLYRDNSKTHHRMVDHRRLKEGRNALSVVVTPKVQGRHTPDALVDNVEKGGNKNGL